MHKRSLFQYRFSRRWTTTLSVLLVIVLISGGTYTGYLYGRRSTVPSAKPPSIFSNTGAAPSSVGSVDFGLFWQAWNAVDDNFFGDTSASKRLDGAISGMVAGLGDPFTLYLPPSSNKIFQSDLEGSFGGIGAELNAVNGQLVIVAPLDGSPAAQAGLKAQDVITKIDNTKVTDLNFNDAIDKIRGDKGTKVALTITRQGVDQPFVITVTRDTVVVKSVKTEDIGKDNSIAYVKINQFGSDTTDLLKTALEDVAKNNKKGIVIDLRDNPGGFLDGAAQDIGFFLPQTVNSSQDKLKSKVAVQEHFKDGSEKDDPAGSTSILPDLPMVILVNGGSASASEIFTGAMRDYDRAKIVGTKTFGKGSAQQLIPLSNGGSVKVTIAKWFTPLGVGIDGKGLQPDVTVELPKDVTASDNDAQINQALSIFGESK